MNNNLNPNNTKPPNKNTTHNKNNVKDPCNNIIINPIFGILHGCKNKKNIKFADSSLNKTDQKHLNGNDNIFTMRFNMVLDE